LLFVWAACSLAGAGTYQGELVVEDFESFTWGGEWATVQFSAGADPRMKVVRDPVHSGEQACRLDVPPGESLTLITQHGTKFVGKGDKPPLPLPGVPERVGLWVHGRESGHRLWLRLLDAGGKTADVLLGAVDFEGWKFLAGKVPKLAMPVGLRGLLVRGGAGPLVVDDVTVATSAKQPLYMRVRQLPPDEEFVEGRAARFRVTLQSLAEKRSRGEGEAIAYESDTTERRADRMWFRFSVSAKEPFARTVRMRLDAGVYNMVVRAGGVERRRRVVVHPARRRSRATRPRRAIRGFKERGDALWVYESALSPAVVFETRAKTLTLFRGLADVGLSVPRDGVMKATRPTPRAWRSTLNEPWMLLWFGSSPKWYRVTFADGSQCPTFDVPFLVVFERQPEEAGLDESGLQVKFAREAGRVAVMPLYGIRRLSPSRTTRWKEDLETLGRIAQGCRSWVGALRALPIGVEEAWRVDATRDKVEVRSRFSYLETRSAWGAAPRRVAPAPPLLMLAREAGLPVSISPEPAPTGCQTSVGPYLVVPDADEHSYTISGLLRHVKWAVSDVPRAGPGTEVSLARNYWALSSDAGKIPFWVRHAGERGRGAAESLVRFMLWRENARYAYDAASGQMRAWDGLLWQEQGENEAALAAAEHLRGCWYAGFHGGLWDLLTRRWRHIASLRATVASEGDWATLGLRPGRGTPDAQLNAEVFFARLAARFGRAGGYGQACYRAAKLLVAAGALAAGAPGYTARHGPWLGLGERGGDAAVVGQCRRGSIGFAPGPAPLVTNPSDAGCAFASRHLADYFRRRFRGGPLNFYGREPAEWKLRKFVELQAPQLGGGFRRAPPPAGAYSTNYVFTVEPGPDGWPALVWASHRAPAGGPLIFGSVGTEPHTRGELRRTLTVSPWLRVSAYAAIKVPPPPKKEEAPKPPAPETPPSPPADDKPAQNPP